MVEECLSTREMNDITKEMVYRGDHLKMKCLIVKNTPKALQKNCSQQAQKTDPRLHC